VFHLNYKIKEDMTNKETIDRWAKKQNKIYISGPISGLARKEYMGRFAEVEGMLKRRGYRVMNPTRLAPCRWAWIYWAMEKLLGSDTAYRTMLAYDLWHLMRCDAIFMLHGWQHSRGAKTEQAAAKAFGIDEIEE
jgi:hypothetical protein